MMANKIILTKKWRLLYFPAFLILILCLAIESAYAQPQSSNYKLRDYTFGSGGTENSSSTNYKVFGVVGDQPYGKPNSTNYQIGAGQNYTILPALPGAPTFTNPSALYDRLKIIINTSGNPSDTTFAIAITETTDTNWSNIRFIQSDQTVGSILGIEDFLTYSSWGGASGFYVTGLSQNTTYKIKVKARQGNFTETGWGPEATASTSVPSLTFGVDAHTITFDNLNSGNSYTDSSKSTVLTTSTNAYNGYIIYGRETQVLTSGSETIANFSSPNSAPTTWSGLGFGYTTNDSNLIGGTGNRFTSGGPKYAGFVTSTPGDPVADTAGPVLTELSNDQYTISYRVTADANTAAGSYLTTVVYVVVPTF